MTLPPDVKDREFLKFVEDVNGKVAVRTDLTVKDIEIGKVEIKNSTDDTTAVVKNDGTDNALVVTLNSLPSVTISGDVNVTQGTNPWTVDGTVDIGTMPNVTLTNTCDTSNVGITSNTTDYATETTLGLLNGKITVCDTSNVGITSNSTDYATETTLGLLNGKITVCDTSNVTITNTGFDCTNIPTTIGVTQDTSPWVVDCNDSNVNVTNMIPAVETGLAKDTTLTNNTQKTQIVNGAGSSVTVTGNKLDVNATFQATTSSVSNLWQTETLDGRGYAATTNVLTLATNPEQTFVLFKNPSGSGKLVRVWRIIFGTSSNKPNVFRIYRNATVTAVGTALAVNNLKLGGTANSGLVYKIPTTTSFGTLLTPIILLGSPAGSTLVVDFDLSGYITANENLLITIDPTDISLSFFVTVYWVEA